MDLRDQFNGGYLLRPVAAIDHISIHHTAADRDSTVEELDNLHRNNGWPGIGYHMVVRQTGEVFYVGDVGTERAHTFGQNREGFGIVLCGDFTERGPGPAQVAGTQTAIRFAIEEIGRGVPIMGHREAALSISPTSCPGDTWPEWKDKLF